MKYNIKIAESEGRHAYSVTVNGQRYGADLNHLPRGKNGKRFLVVDGLGIVGLDEAYFSAEQKGRHDCGITHSLPELSDEQKKLLRQKTRDCQACRDYTESHQVLGLVKKVAEDYFATK